MQLRSKRRLVATDATPPPASKGPRTHAWAATTTTTQQRSCTSRSTPRALRERPLRRTSPRISPNSTSNHGRCGILYLPPELRNYIYELTLLRRPIAAVTMNGTAQERHPPPLLQTCAQIREEGSPIYYQSNHFSLDTYGLNLHLQLTWACDASAVPATWTPTLHVGKYSDFDLHISIGTAAENLAVREARTRIKTFVDDGRTSFSRDKLARLMCVLHEYGKMAYERDMRLLTRLRSSLAALRSRAEEMQALLSTPAGAQHADPTGTRSVDAARSVEPNGVGGGGDDDDVSADDMLCVQAVLERA
nr:hypothetical protein CFP56_67714 [Quercus suber]